MSVFTHDEDGRFWNRRTIPITNMPSKLSLGFFPQSYVPAGTGTESQTIFCICERSKNIRCDFVLSRWQRLKLVAPFRIGRRTEFSIIG